MQNVIQSKPVRLTQIALLAALVFLGLSSPASAWWNDEWTMRKKITIDPKAAEIAGPIGASSVLIRLHDGDFQFAAAKDDGTDLRFVSADDKTALPFHIEKYDSLLGEAFVWVKVPDLKDGAPTTIWLYFANQGPKAVKADDSKATYDADTVLVYHFGEKGASATDFTLSGNSAQNPGLPSDGAMIGGGVRFDGNSGIGIAASPSLAWSDGGAMTWSAWIKPALLAPNAHILTRREGANALVIGVDNGMPFVEVTGAAGTQRSAAGAPMAAKSWHHLAVVAEPSKITVYLDGEVYATLAAPLPALNSLIQLGAEKDAPVASASFVGELDEMQISKAARSAGFIKLAANGQGGEKAAKLLTLGADEQQTGIFSGLATGTFGVIIKSLTVDGWVVICILAVMALMSWFVMLNKISYLNAIAKGNALFMDQWARVATDLTALESADGEKFKTMGGTIDQAGHKALRGSSVYRIYHIGVEEIRHRLAADLSEGSRKALSGRSIQAIRASLDGGLVRETQKINSLIVLLTICISGGPFLGLLGTVVGVMITFAAVAAAGEVNVNAIAPGIAAALLATVAGLAVAIPSLFGYNYILSRVKDSKDDMHIFIDEFVSKMAEFYHERPTEPRASKEALSESFH